MAQPKWLTKYFVMKSEVSQIYDDLEQYREFCVSHGRIFNEAALYNERDRDFSDFMRFKERGYARNQWNWANKDPNEAPRKPYNKDHKGPRGFNNYRSGHRNNA